MLLPISTARRMRTLKSAFILPLCFALTTATALSALPTPGDTATKYYDPGGGNQRINMSGRLRMLSQRIPGMACNNADGIEPEKSSANLRAAVAEFSTILEALTVGNEELGIIGPENHGKTLIRIGQVGDVWATLNHLAVDLGPVDIHLDAISVAARYHDAV